MCVALSRRGLLSRGLDGWWKGVKGWLLPSVRVVDGGSSECRTLLYGLLMGCTRSTVPIRLARVSFSSMVKNKTDVRILLRVHHKR
ncbi:hypothetical protein GOBAR_AA06584 [Gossypium barbadense]|uniref:Uncharacterized protein n=1 Tax=Gossypium barbadense TaxID=3634 RepID=A0A2P5YEH0_GOSBA|nr:hypothetical protein GOBAR_AA06584 [Gossypium barbadense]